VFGVGLAEMALIAFVAIIAFGPDRCRFDRTR